MKKSTRIWRTLTRGEKALYTLGFLCLILTIVLKVFSSASASNIKMDIEKISYKIEAQEKKNQSLMMQVNELISYENLSPVLNDKGLAYNNENIIVVK